MIIFQDSHIVRLVCDDPKQQEELTKELERDEDGQQCFLADPGWAKIEITTFFRQALPFLWSLLRWTKIYSGRLSTEDMMTLYFNLTYRSCVSLKSQKEQLTSYEEFRAHLSSNIVQHSWSKDLAANVEKTAEYVPMETLDTGLLNIRIENSWSESREVQQSETISGVAVESFLPSFLVEDDVFCSDSQNIKGPVRSNTLQKRFTCTQCDYSSDHKKNLKTHMRQHTGDLPYTCTQCQRSYPTNQSLKRHIMTHTGERPFKCVHCSSTYRRHEHLKRHMTRQHIGEKH